MTTQTECQASILVGKHRYYIRFSPTQIREAYLTETNWATDPRFNLNWQQAAWLCKRIRNAALLAKEQA